MEDLKNQDPNMTNKDEASESKEKKIKVGEKEYDLGSIEEIVKAYQDIDKIRAQTAEEAQKIANEKKQLIAAWNYIQDQRSKTQVQNQIPSRPNELELSLKELEEENPDLARTVRAFIRESDLTKKELTELKNNLTALHQWATQMSQAYNYRIQLESSHKIIQEFPDADPIAVQMALMVGYSEEQARQVAKSSQDNFRSKLNKKEPSDIEDYKKRRQDRNQHQVLTSKGSTSVEPPFDPTKSENPWKSAANAFAEYLKSQK